MEINITLLPDVECVYLLCGKFFEGNSFVTSSDNVVFLTVLPLDAKFSPYTVKLIGGRVVSNENIALSCKITDREYALKLSKRYDFIYNEDHRNFPDGELRQFFYYIKGKHFNLVAKMLSPALRASLSDYELSAFFAEFVDLIKYKEYYYAVDKTGVGHKCSFSFDGGKIDDIFIE